MVEEFTLICKSGHVGPCPNSTTTTSDPAITYYSLGFVFLIYKIKGCRCTLSVVLTLYDMVQTLLCAACHEMLIALIPLCK